MLKLLKISHDSGFLTTVYNNIMNLKNAASIPHNNRHSKLTSTAEKAAILQYSGKYQQRSSLL